MPSKNSQMTNHGCRHIFGLWKNCISGQEVISHFCEKSCNSHKEAISQSLDYLLLGVCHIVCWVHGLRFWDPQIQALTLTLFLILHKLICLPKNFPDDKSWMLSYFGVWQKYLWSGVCHIHGQKYPRWESVTFLDDEYMWCRHILGCEKSCISARAGGRSHLKGFLV